MSKKLLTRNKGKLFESKYRNRSTNSRSYLLKNSTKEYSFDDIKNTNIMSTSSFRYNDKLGMVSTQELNIDYSFFENHTFFHSAEAKTNEAFVKIINEYPFDGSLKNIEAFEDSLTGYEKHVLDRFPKNVGYLIFSGTQKGETITNGTYLSIKDAAGIEYKSISKNKSGDRLIDPRQDPVTFEMYIKLPENANDNQIILQKRSSLANNVTLALSQSSSATSCNAIFGITSGSNYVFASTPVPKGRFFHLSALYNRGCEKRLKLIIFDDKGTTSTNTIVSSSNTSVFDGLDYLGSDLTIGYGVDCRLNNVLFEPQESFSGSIDDFRYYRRDKKLEEIKKNRNMSVSGDDNLILYYKFNEPFGDYSGNNIVLDSSGNSFNTSIKNFNYLVNRNTGSDAPVSAEIIDHSPVLFSGFDGVETIYTDMTTSGSDYDTFNPNLITKLIPPHYLDEGNEFENFKHSLEKISDTYTTVSTPRSNTSAESSVQTLLKFLFIWAKHFDEIKLFVDNFSLFKAISYDDKNTIADKFLAHLGRSLGIKLPDLFRSANISQVFNGVNLLGNDLKSVKSLNEIQNFIWRRILSDSTNIITSKGTLGVIKSIFRSSGIEPDNIFHLREYGGAKRRSLEGSKQNIKDVLHLLNMSGSLDHQDETVDAQGKSSSSPYISSKFLSSSRIEIGHPKIRGTYTDKSGYTPHGISNNASDGLLTSGSFTFQCTYMFGRGVKHSVTQSLARLHVTGTAAPSTNESCIINLLYNNTENKIRFLLSDGVSNTSIKEMYLTGVNIFDNNPWAVSFGKETSEQISSDLTSSYFLRAAKCVGGNIVNNYYTSSFFNDESDSVLANISTYNTSGSFLCVGSQSLNSTSKFINNGTTDKKTTYFSGMFSYLNFWSNANEISDFEAYAKNPNSIGSVDPIKNYNFNKVDSGSFERIRVQTNGNQATTASNSSGEFRLFDFSQNNFHLDGSGFENNKKLFKSHYVVNEILSTNFDLNSSENKIRIRSIQDLDIVKQHEFATTAPIYEVLPSEEVFDDTRFSIDMSSMRGLNENIMTIFSNFEPLDNALGQPNAVFADRYQDLVNLRKVYFNNVIERLDLGKYRELFKWIDNTYTDIIFSLIPRSTTFLGINFVYESHVLERNKFKYLYDEIYLKSLPRDPHRGNLLLSLFSTKLKKLC